MKKLLKLSVSVVLVISMILSMGAIGFAANLEANPDVISSHVEFVLNDAKTEISAQAFVRNYTNDKTASLIIASYDEGKLLAVEKASGINTVLKTNAIATGTDVKAFVWEEASNKIITDIANYSKVFEEVLKGLEITLDGEVLHLSSFDSNFEYTKDYGTATEVTLPTVEAKIADNAASVSVTNDADAMKTTVKVCYGETKVEEISIPNLPTYKRDSYSSSYEREYVINYDTYKFVKEDGKIYTDEFTPSTSKVAGSGNQYAYMHKKSFGLDEGETVKNVEFTIPSAMQSDVVVVKPQAPSFEFDNVVVNADGSKFAPVDDMDNTNSKVYAVGIATDTGTSFDIAPEKVLKDAVSVTINNAAAPTLHGLYSNFHENGANGNMFDSGSRLAKDRSPLTGNMMCLGGSFNDATKVLVGAPYIAFGWNDINSKKVDISFYINQAVDVYVLTRSSSATYMGDGWSAIDAGKTLNWKYQDYVYGKVNGISLTSQPNYDSSGTNIGASKNVSIIPVAYAIAKGLIKEYNLSLYSASTPDKGYYRIFPHGLVEKYGLNGINLTVDTEKFPLFALTEADKYNSSGVLQGSKYYSASDELTLEYALSVIEENKADAVVTPAASSELVSAPVKLEGTGNLVVDVKSFEVDEIYGTGIGSYRVHPDRSTNQVGHVISYPQVFELYGNANVRNYIGVVNDSAQFVPSKHDLDSDGVFSDVEIVKAGLKSEVKDATKIANGEYDYFDEAANKYYNASQSDASLKKWYKGADGGYYSQAYYYNYVKNSAPLYEFTVNEDAEVIIFGSGDYKALLKTNGWTDEAAKWVDITNTDAIKVFHAAPLSFHKVSARKVEAGEKVTFYSPKNGSHFLIFVRPIK